MKERPICEDCIYKHTEYRNTGYGMPVESRDYCIREEQHKPCAKEVIIKSNQKKNDTRK